MRNNINVIKYAWMLVYMTDQWVLHKQNREGLASKNRSFWYPCRYYILCI